MSTSTVAVAAGRVVVGRYLDSVLLMRLAKQLSDGPGVRDAAAVMGTDANKSLLADGGFTTPDLDGAGPNDVVIVVQADDSASAAAALARIDELLLAESSPPAAGVVSTLDDALEAQPASNLAVISVPGEYAAAEARHALERGLHTFIFSSNVALDDEVDLKRIAAERGLLCMGPDCGTALIAGQGIGFANAVRRGPVGVVAASGTGIQAVTSQLERWGVGVSHAIGAGSRDATDAVGGVTMLAGLRALDADVGTSAILVLSKPPGRRTACRVREAAAAAAKPVVLCFLGDATSALLTLDDAARAVAVAAGAPPPPASGMDEGAVGALRRSLAPEQRWIRALYAGGTFAFEAQLVLAAAGLRVAANSPLRPELALRDASRSEGHTVVDLGAEEFTRGRPHPMIDARNRCARILAEADDPEVAVLVLDVVLGFGAAADPAGDLVGALTQARATARRRGSELLVVASVCGTAGDPQDFDQQVKTLQDAGVLVVPTNAEAVRLAAQVVPGVSS